MSGSTPATGWMTTSAAVPFTGKLNKLTIKLVPPERSAKEENLIRKQTQQVVNAGQ